MAASQISPEAELHQTTGIERGGPTTETAREKCRRVLKSPADVRPDHDRKQ